MDAGVAPTIPAFSTVMACSTSMVGAIEAARMIDGVNRNLALVGGVESMSKIQLGLGQSLSDWIRKFQQARSLGQKVSCERSRSDHLAGFASLEIVRRFLRRRSSCRGVATPARSHIAVRSFDPAVATGAPCRFRSIGRSRSESETRRQARSCTRRGTSRRYR